VAQRKRPRAFNRLPVWDGDHGDDLTQVFPWITTHPWNGTTVPDDPPGVWYSAPPPGDSAVTWTFTGQQSRSIMTVNPDGEPSPSSRQVASHLWNRVTVLKARGQADRITDEMLALLPTLPARHTAREIVSEAAALTRLLHESDPGMPS